MKKPVKITLWVIGIVIGLPLLFLIGIIVWGSLEDSKWDNFSKNLNGTWNVEYVEKVTNEPNSHVESRVDYHENYVFCFSSTDKGYVMLDGQRTNFEYWIDEVNHRIGINGKLWIRFGYWGGNLSGTKVKLIDDGLTERHPNYHGELYYLVKQK